MSPALFSVKNNSFIQEKLGTFMLQVVYIYIHRCGLKLPKGQCTQS